MSDAKPPLQITVVSDYICPFCYVGNARVERLRAHYDLKVNWALIEIHPDTPAEGQTLDKLGYPPEQLAQMQANLKQMVAEEGLAWKDPDYTTNSRQALLLSEAVKLHQPEAFAALHKALFEAHFGGGENIGDEGVLRRIAAGQGVDQALVDRAWNDEEIAKKLAKYLDLARLWQVSGVPSFIIGQQILVGAVPFEQMHQAAEQALASDKLDH